MHRRKHQQLLGRWLNFTKSENTEHTEDFMLSASSQLPSSSDPASVGPLTRAISSSGSSTGAVSVGTRRRLRNALPSREGASSLDGSCADDDSSQDVWEHPMKSTVSVKSTDSSTGNEKSKQQQSPRRVFSKSPRNGKGNDSRTSSKLTKSSPEIPVFPERVDRKVSNDASHETRHVHSTAYGPRKSFLEDSESVAISSSSKLNVPQSTLGSSVRTLTQQEPPIASLPLMIQKIEFNEALLYDDASTGALSHGDRDLRNKTDVSNGTTFLAHSDNLQMSFAVQELIVQDDDDGPDIEVYSKRGTAEQKGRLAHHQSFESSGAGILEFAIESREARSDEPKVESGETINPSNDMALKSRSLQGHSYVGYADTTLLMPKGLAMHSNDGIATSGTTICSSELGEVNTRPSASAFHEDQAWDAGRGGCTIDPTRLPVEANVACDDLDADLSDSFGERDASSVLLPVKLTATVVNRVLHASCASLNFDDLYQEECYSGRQHHSVSTLPSPRAQLNALLVGDGGVEAVSPSLDPKSARDPNNAAERQMIRLAMERSLRDCVGHQRDQYDSSMDSAKQSSRASVSVSTVYVPDSAATQRLQSHDHSFSSHASFSSQRRGIIGPEDISTSEDQEREMIELALELSLQDSKASQASITSRSESVSTAHTDCDYPYLDTGSSHSRNSRFSQLQQTRPQQLQHRVSASEVESTSLQAARAKQPVHGTRFSHENSLLFELDDYDDDDNDEELLTPATVRPSATLDFRQSWIGPCPPPPPPPPEPQLARHSTITLPLSPSQRSGHTHSPHDHNVYLQTSTFDGRPRPMYEWERRLMNNEMSRNSYFAANEYDDDHANNEMTSVRTEWAYSPGTSSRDMQDSRFQSQVQPHSPENRSKSTSFSTPQHSPDGRNRRHGSPSHISVKGQSKGLEDLRSIEHQLEAEEFWIRQPSPRSRPAPRMETEAERMEREMLELAMERSVRES